MKNKKETMYENCAGAAGKAVFRPLMLCMMLLLTWMCAFQVAGAAGSPCESKYINVGMKGRIAGNYFWLYDYQNQDICYSKSYSGSGKTLVDLQYGESVNGSLISNGVYVYFAKQDGSTTQVCRVNIKNGKIKQLGSYRGDYALEGYYNGKVYVSDCYETVCHTLYVLNLKTGKLRKVFSDPFGECKQYGQYFVCRMAHGDPSPTSLIVYNAKTGSRKTIAKLAGYFTVIDGLLYYTEFEKYNAKGNYFPMSIKRATLQGKSKKTLAKKIKMSMAMPVAFQKTYALYFDTRGSGNLTYYKVSYGSGKITKTRQSTYDKLSALYQL